MKFVLSVIVGLLLFPFLNAQQRDPQSSGIVPRLVTYSGKALDEQGKPHLRHRRRQLCHLQR